MTAYYKVIVVLHKITKSYSKLSLYFVTFLSKIVYHKIVIYVKKYYYFLIFFIPRRFNCLNHYAFLLIKQIKEKKTFIVKLLLEK